MVSASSTTWLFVRMAPSGVKTTPEPVPRAIGSSPPPPRPKKCGEDVGLLVARGDVDLHDAGAHPLGHRHEAVRQAPGLGRRRLDLRRAAGPGRRRRRGDRRWARAAPEGAGGERRRAQSACATLERERQGERRVTGERIRRARRSA